jgi:hypothetical protein
MLAYHGRAHYARLEFAEALRGHERANYVQVCLPNGQTLDGSLLVSRWPLPFLFR